jgi:hypothetical protein
LDDVQLFFLSLPTLIWYLLFCYLPMFGLIIAFKKYKVAPGKGFLWSLFNNSQWCGLENFRFLFANNKETTINMFRNTVGYNIVFIVLGVVLPVTLAIMISHLKSQKVAKVTQTAMFPVKVEVGVENRTLFDDKAALLSSLGFDISPFGTDTVVVNGVPEGFSAEPGKVQAMVGDLLLILSDDSSSLPGVMESSLAEKFALLGASSAAGVTSPAEARRIVDALLSCDNPEITAKGRKIMAVMPLSALEKLF